MACLLRKLPRICMRITFLCNSSGKPGIDVPRPDPVKDWVVYPAVTFQPSVPHSSGALWRYGLSVYQGPFFAPMQASQKCQFVTISMPLYGVIQSTCEFGCDIECPRFQLKLRRHIIKTEAHCFLYPVCIAVVQHGAGLLHIFLIIHFSNSLLISSLTPSANGCAS